jgi:hypothetical protein
MIEIIEIHAKTGLKSGGIRYAKEERRTSGDREIVRC